MAIEWTLLSQSTAQRFDTPELVKKRNAVNAEIAEILEERQKIDAALNVVKVTPIDQLSVAQLKAARKAKEASFDLLKRELGFRRDVLPEFFNLSRETAKAAASAQNRTTEQLEAGVAKGLEELGYEKWSRTNPHGYDDVMIRRNARVMASLKIASECSHFATNYDDTRENREVMEVLERDLNRTMRELIGVSNGIETSPVTHHIVNGVG